MLYSYIFMHDMFECVPDILNHKINCITFSLGHVYNNDSRIIYFFILILVAFHQNLCLQSITVNTADQI